MSNRRSTLSKILSKSLVQEADGDYRKNEELYSWVSKHSFSLKEFLKDFQELGSALARVGRDPEYDALDYLTVINEKLAK